MHRPTSENLGQAGWTYNICDDEHLIIVILYGELIEEKPLLEY